MGTSNCFQAAWRHNYAAHTLTQFIRTFVLQGAGQTAEQSLTVSLAISKV